MNIKNDFLNDLLYMACRYAVGRRSIGSLMMAPDIAKYISENYNEFGETNVKKLIDDIKNTINERLRMTNVGKYYKPEDNLMQILLKEHYDGINNPTIDKDLMRWSDLVGAFEPNLEITLNDSTTHKGFYSMIDNEVVIKTCECYLENPYINVYVDNKFITFVKTTFIKTLES